MRKKWYIREQESEKIKKLGTGDNNPLIARILAGRGIRDEAGLRGFLYGTLDDLHDPFLLEGMENAVRRVQEAVSRQEKIVIYGDYDVDGITATALLYRYFREELGAEVEYYLPNRLEEGYGLNLEAVQGFIQKGYDLLITVDCGITALTEVEYAAENGLDVLITDHHQPGEELPGAAAVLDPHRDDYPFKELAGVGVAFKLCQALEIERGEKAVTPALVRLLDLVCLGTVADIVPLTGENRLLVKRGLEVLKESTAVGLQELLKKTGLDDQELNPGRVGFVIAPPFNAAGRMKDPTAGLKLLLSESAVEAAEMAGELVRLNKERQALEEKIFQDALKRVEEELDLEREKALVLASREWHQGVIGIVASRLVERYYRPVVLIALQDGRGRGSCRSIKGLNIHRALKACSGDLLGFGGHEMAAGLEIEEGKVGLLRRDLNNYLDRTLSSDDLIPRLELDAVLSRELINLDFYRELRQLEPFGVGNPRPVFLLSGAAVRSSYPVGREGKHLKFTLAEGIKGIGFGMAEKQAAISGGRVDLACSLTLNDWKGRQSVELQLEDYNPREDPDSFPVYYRLGSIRLADKRGCRQPAKYLQQLLDSGQKTALFLNDRGVQERLSGELQGEVFSSIFKGDLEDFQRVKGGILIFSNPSFAGGLEIDQLVFLSLPFSLREMLDSCRLFQGDYTIHLLFGREQRELNRNIIKRRIPDDRYLRRFYLYLQALKKKEVQLEELERVLPDAEQNLKEKSLTILEELGLLSRQRSLVRLHPAPVEKLDLSSSIGYNDTVNIVNQFKKIAELAYSEDLSGLVRLINKSYRRENNGFEETDQGYS